MKWTCCYLIVQKFTFYTYTLQSTRAKFSRNTIQPYCKLCKESDETIEHFLLDCISLSDARQRYMEKLFKILREIEGGGTIDVINDGLLLEFILDCSALDLLSNQPIEKLLDIERETQDLCYHLHMKRTKLLCKTIGQQYIKVHNTSCQKNNFTG
ncbi:unnamed protein product [Mytilus coruscus]|uniref:Reverse transcriptase zinc-binding domain-containing protein n=1 Tax=Mytilus coruscus TaxID=42192 RepID=A0A6J8AKU4_MYTCO|nr:unnamed protein product [Mytilus coruscus]